MGCRGYRALALPRQRGDFWKFSPSFDLSLYRSIKQRFKHPPSIRQMLFTLICSMLEYFRMPSGRAHFLTSLFYPSRIPGPAFSSSCPRSSALPLPVRIWNTTRIERKLVDQEKALLQARMDALISQINPHFLFNTLNTIASLIRFDPDTARTVLVKLSNILRRRLKAQVPSRRFRPSWISSTTTWSICFRA